MDKGKEKEIVDLIPNKDGVYSTESTHHPIAIKKQVNKPKKKNDNMEQLFEGMDVGLDFVEGVSKRLNRLFKLRD